MRRRPSQAILSLGPVLLASLLLAGCPKKPAPAPVSGATLGSSVTAGAGPGTAGSESGTVDAAPGALGTGPGGAGGPGAAGSAAPGAAAATGTTVPALPAPTEFVETQALRDIHFDFDKSEIRAQDAAILKANAAWLQANPKALLLVEGHADERGTSEYNLALGERRANATRDYFVSLGIEAARVTIISYGKERPLCAAHTEVCWGPNRRAHFLVKP